MAEFCLVPALADKFKQDIVSGKIDPEKLALMTSAERNAFFAESLGKDNATKVNALFESKLLLKNQQAGMINWAKRVMGTIHPAQRDIISKIQRMDRILNPAEQDAFLEDLASQRLGTHITFDEAAKITDLSKKVETTKASLKPETKVGSPERMNYGRATVELKNYINEIKLKANKLSVSQIVNNPGKSALRALSEAAGNLKAIQASLDDSAIFRQGWKTLFTHPNIWAKNALQSFVNIIKTFGKDQVMSELNADISSRPNALNKYYDKAKLDVGVNEEAFPTTLPEKIPVLGKIYKATENAYTAFVRKTRADVFDKYIQIAEKSDVDLDDKELKSIGKLVNSLTGRGDLSIYGINDKGAKFVNNIFFSPKALQANIDTLLLHPISGAGGSDFARKQAAINLVKVVSGIATILGIARVLKKNSVEFDPRSANFGKIKIGDTRFDVTAGMSALTILAGRMLTQSTKNSSTGAVSKLNARDKNDKPVFGAPTTKDVFYNFFEGKLSPIAGAVKDILQGADFNGNKPTILNEIKGHSIPLPITTFLELKKDPNSANILASMIADALGIAANTYASTKPKSNAVSTPKFHY